MRWFNSERLGDVSGDREETLNKHINGCKEFVFKRTSVNQTLFQLFRRIMYRNLSKDLANSRNIEKEQRKWSIKLLKKEEDEEKRSITSKPTKKRWRIMRYLTALRTLLTTENLLAYKYDIILLDTNDQETEKRPYTIINARLLSSPESFDN